MVEGKSDYTFIDAITNRLFDKNIEELGYYAVIAGNKKLVKQITAALTSTGREIAAFMDYNKSDFNALINDLLNSINSKGFKASITQENMIRVEDTGSAIKLIPLGLPQDSTLKNIGITQHEMEDYLLKLIEIDKNVANWIEITPNDLTRDAKDAKLDTNKSENLFKYIALKKGIQYEEMIKEIIKRADESNLRKIVANIIKLLEQ